MTGEEKEEVAEELEKDSKVINISGEAVRVYPKHCVNHGHCFQCQHVMGKILCEPRHRIAPTLTKDQKVAIARDAKARGVKVVANEQRIPLHIVRAWVGAYTRQSSKTKHRGKTPQDPNQYCAICGRKLRLARRTSMPEGQYCSRCTGHVLPFLRKGLCPECKGHLSAEPWGIPRKSVQVRELICESCGKRWPALDEAPPGNGQESVTSVSDNEELTSAPLSHNGETATPTLSLLDQRIAFIQAKLSELEEQQADLERESAHYRSLLLHYEKVRDAEANGLSLQSTGDHNGQQ